MSGLWFLLALFGALVSGLSILLFVLGLKMMLIALDQQITRPMAQVASAQPIPTNKEQSE